MNAVLPATETDFPEEELARAHYRLYSGAAILRIIECAARSLGDFETLFKQFPFLVAYNDELAGQGLAGHPVDQAVGLWNDKITAFEAQITAHLPLRDLRNTFGLEHEAISLLAATGLVDEDPEFSALFSAFDGGSELSFPTLALLSSWWYADVPEARAAIRTLGDKGLIELGNLSAPRAHWTLRQSSLVRDLLQGEAAQCFGTWGTFRRSDQFEPLEALIFEPGLAGRLQQAAALLKTGDLPMLILRGPQHNGRRTLAGALAKGLERNVLEIEVNSESPEVPWRSIDTLTILLDAVPVLIFDLAPGEITEIPDLGALDRPLFIVLGPCGGVTDGRLERSLTLALPIPGPTERRKHWEAALPVEFARSLPETALRYRMSSGNLRRTARLAVTQAQLAGRDTLSDNDVLVAARAQNRNALEILASPVEITGTWDDLAVDQQTFADMRELEGRCRHREQLPEQLRTGGACQLGFGVRALFEGASGTGKTLAARILASALKMDLYRLNLASIVNKYIGETEKNLERVFARAVELDVILLLDEGDALMTQRTAVQSSNDRYANLETNYLLQRMENYEGILIVTTNAVNRIDSAFQRRMDVVVDFPLPDYATRLAIWDLHLPSVNELTRPFLENLADRCDLTGGQIRNAAIHASLLALMGNETVGEKHVVAAVEREYRKSGALCPLRTRTQSGD